jgi:hypothetical protein
MRILGARPQPFSVSHSTRGISARSKRSRPPSPTRSSSPWRRRWRRIAAAARAPASARSVSGRRGSGHRGASLGRPGPALVGSTPAARPPPRRLDRWQERRAASGSTNEGDWLLELSLTARGRSLGRRRAAPRRVGSPSHAPNSRAGLRGGARQERRAAGQASGPVGPRTLLRHAPRKRPARVGPVGPGCQAHGTGISPAPQAAHAANQGAPIDAGAQLRGRARTTSLRPRASVAEPARPATAPRRESVRRVGLGGDATPTAVGVRDAEVERLAGRCARTSWPSGTSRRSGVGSRVRYTPTRE